MLKVSCFMLCPCRFIIQNMLQACATRLVDYAVGILARACQAPSVHRADMSTAASPFGRIAIGGLCDELFGATQSLPGPPLGTYAHLGRKKVDVDDDEDYDDQSWGKDWLGTGGSADASTIAGRTVWGEGESAGSSASDGTSPPLDPADLAADGEEGGDIDPADIAADGEEGGNTKTGDTETGNRETGNRETADNEAGEDPDTWGCWKAWADAGWDSWDNRQWGRGWQDLGDSQAITQKDISDAALKLDDQLKESGQMEHAIAAGSGKEDETNHDGLLTDIKTFMSGAVDHQSKLALRFRRETDKGERGTTKAERLAFRNKWAQDLYDTVKETRRQTQENIDEDLSAGTYEPFDVIHQKEGGLMSQENLTAALRYCQRCIEEGGKWVRIHKWTRRLEFLYVKQGFRKTFRQGWALERVDSKSTASDNKIKDKLRGKADADKSDPANKDEGASARAAGAPQPKAKGKAKGKAEATAPSTRRGAKRGAAALAANGDPLDGLGNNIHHTTSGLNHFF